MPRPNLEDIPDKYFQQILEMVRKDPNILKSDVSVPQLGFKSPKDLVTTYKTTKMIGGYTLSPSQRAIADQYFGTVDPTKTATATATPMASATATPMASATALRIPNLVATSGAPAAAAAAATQRAAEAAVKQSGSFPGLQGRGRGGAPGHMPPVSSQFRPMADDLYFGNNLTTEGNAQAWADRAMERGGVDIVNDPPPSNGQAAQAALAVAISGGNFAPGLFTNPSGVNFGPNNGSNPNYKTPLPLPITPETGLDEYGRNIGNWQQWLIANGLSPVDPNVPPPPPFVPGATDTPPPFVPDGNGGGGGVTDTGPGTNTGGGFFGPQSMAEMMAMFTQMKDLFGDDGGQLDQIMAMYTELQKSMMDLQNKYIQSLIDAQKPIAPPVAPAPNLGPEAFVPPYISPSAQNGAYLEMSDPGMGALYNMNPMYLQSVQQMLNTLGYKGAGVAGRYGERSYSRPGGPGSLAIGDAAYENAANYVGLPATERENAEAAMRYFFGEMGNSPRYQFPGRPQYPTRA